MEKKRTWLNGDYIVGDINVAIVRADEDQITLRYLKFLDSEPEADSPLSWEPKGVTPKGDDCVIIKFEGETYTCVISEDKKMIVGGPETLTWIPPEEAEEIRKRPRQPVSAPEVPLHLHLYKYLYKYLFF